MTLTLVVAMAENRVIGRAGTLPWHLPADLKHFKAVTMGKPIVMGRKTFDSIGRPLPGRRNIVITRNVGWSADGVEVAPSLDAAIEMAGADEVMVVGGGQVYAEAMPRAGRLEVTEVAVTIDGDAYFPAIDKSLWRECARETHPAADGKPAYAFVSYERA